jgi:fused signal recognition particle receptor
VVEEAEKRGANLVLIDTAGRLHTSDDLMRELTKVVSVTRKRAASFCSGDSSGDSSSSGDGKALPVKTVLVIDATTGQNGLAQAREFDAQLDLDGVIITKLDGTAKGGIAVAISHELKVPVLRIGVGEHIDDLRPFNALEYARAILGSE